MVRRVFDAIASPVDLGGLHLKNRIIFAPTTMGSSSGGLGGRLASIAAGGCALVFVGDVPVSKNGSFSLGKKKGNQHYHELCEAVHAHDCLVGAQLHRSDSNMKGMLKYLPGVAAKKITPDQLRILLNDEVGSYISSLDAGKVADITASFGEAAVHALDAGFDIVQVHGDRMCGSFSSSVFNVRTDSYGGSAEARASFAVEAVSSIRRALPEVPIDFKLAVRQENPHYGNAGVLVDELPVFVPMLEEAGVTSFHVALANHSDLEDTIPSASHPWFSEEGCFLRFCDEVRKHTKVPLTGVGGLTQPEFVEEQISSGRIDCAAMSRQLIADAAWPNKVIDGHPDQVRRCIRCNKDCLGGMKRHEGVGCIFDHECARAS